MMVEEWEAGTASHGILSLLPVSDFRPGVFIAAAYERMF